MIHFGKAIHIHIVIFIEILGKINGKVQLGQKCVKARNTARFYMRK